MKRIFIFLVTLAVFIGFRADGQSPVLRNYYTTNANPSLSGPAGGALTGNYPNPGFSVTQFIGGSGYSNITYVSLSGSDSTGAVHDAAHPYLNVSNAVFAASATATSNNIEVVQVGPGLIPNCSFIGRPYVAVRGSGKYATTLWFEPPTNAVNAYPMMSDLGGGWGANAGGVYSLSDCSIIYSRGTNENINLSEAQDPGNIGVVAGIGVTNCLGAFIFTNAGSKVYIDIGNFSYIDCRVDPNTFATQQSTNINTLAGGGPYTTFAMQFINGVSYDFSAEILTDLAYNGILTSNIDVPDGNLPVYIGYAKLTNPSGGQGDASAWLNYGAGLLHFHAKQIDPSATQNSLWWNQGCVPASYFNTEQQSFFYCDWCRNYIYTSGASTNQVNWFYLGSIGNENAGNGALVLDGGRNYVYAQKAYDKSGSGNAGIISLGGLNVAYNWINIQKVTRTQDESFVFGGNTNYESWVNILHYEDLVASPTKPGIVNTANSKLHIGGGYLKVNSGIGVQQQGTNSWLYLDGGLRIDTSAGGSTSYALDVQSSNVYLGSVTMTNPASAPSIHSTSAQNVINSGGTWSSANSSGITLVDMIGDYNATNLNVSGSSTLNAVTVNTLTASNNTIFKANGTPASGKVATGTDSAGDWTWQSIYPANIGTVGGSGYNGNQGPTTICTTPNDSSFHQYTVNGYNYAISSALTGSATMTIIYTNLENLAETQTVCTLNLGTLNNFAQGSVVIYSRWNSPIKWQIAATENTTDYQPSITVIQNSSGQ